MPSLHALAVARLRTNTCHTLPDCLDGFRSLIDVQGAHLVPLREKQRLFFLYEKRIRELSNAEKVFEASSLNNLL